MGDSTRYHHILEFPVAVAYDRRLVSSVGRAPDYRAYSRARAPNRTNTQGLKITEENMLPLQ